MLRRFNLMFTVLDEERCVALEGDARDDDEFGIDVDAEDVHVNPFESAQCVICSLSFLVDNPLRQHQAREAGWDLMVVDEAHHLHWHIDNPSAGYLCVESLAGQIPGLLLLTATPEQLGLKSHFARLRLLDPDRYHDFDVFRAEESQYREVRELVEALQGDALADLQQDADAFWARLYSYIGEAAAKDLRQCLQRDIDSEDTAQAVEDVIRSLLDCHGTGRVLFRNTRDAVAGFPERRLNLYSLPAPENYGSASTKAPLASRLQPEILLGDEWLAQDPRVSWLAAWLKNLRDSQDRQEKALVICAHADTASELEDYLNLRQGIRTAVFHEGMTLLERDRAAAYFADDGPSAQVLVCSEIGSEGRNFQFVRHLVLFDLPLNPDLLEQRIGRLDRIGQSRTVQIHVPFYDNSPQQILMRWYRDGLNAFERVCPVGSAIREQVAEELERLLTQQASAEEIDRLVANTRDLTETALAQLQQGRDRLLELSSCHPRRARQLMDAIQDAETPLVLDDYMARVFDKFGVDSSHHSANAIILRPSEHLTGDSFASLPEDGITVTFRRDTALSREDMEFLSWEHPMVAGAMEMISTGNFGNVTLCTLKLPLKPGTLLLETCFTLHCPAPRRLQIHRFMPTTILRIVVDATGKDLTNVLTSEHLDRLGQKIAKGTARDVVRHTRDQIAAMIKQAEQHVAQKADALDGGEPIASAVARMEKYQRGEQERLQSLAKVNPNIRQDEIDYVTETTKALQQALSKAEWRLDSLRVAITV